MYYDISLPHSIMLVEPAMLLLYRSCEHNPQLTDILVDYLNKLVFSFDEKKKFECMKSVKKVLKDC